MDDKADVIRVESPLQPRYTVKQWEVGLIGCMAKLPLIAYAGKLQSTVNSPEKDSYFQKERKKDGEREREIAGWWLSAKTLRIVAPPGLDLKKYTLKERARDIFF